MPSAGGDVLEHAAFPVAVVRAGGDPDGLGQLQGDVVEVEVLEHRAAAGGVRVDVEGDGLSLRHGPVDAGERLADAAPVPFPGRFVVRDVHRAAGGDSDPQRFFDGVQQVVAFVAHVRGIDAAQRRRLLRKLLHLRRLRIPPWLVDQSGREATGALLHRLPHHPSHVGEFGAGWLPALVAHGESPHRVVSHEHDVVDRRRQRFAGREVAGEVGPVSHPNEGASGRRAAPRPSRRRAETAVATDHGRHALGELELHARVADEGAVVVRMRIDKARREDEPGSIDFDVPGRCFANVGDEAVGDRHIARPARAAGAIDDSSVAKSEVRHVGYSSVGV